MEKARDVFFHEYAIAPAVPMLYGDDNAPCDASEGIEGTKTTKILPPSPMKPKFTIRIPPRHARMPVIREVSPEEDDYVECETSKQISNIPDFLQGTTRSGKQCGEIQALTSIEDKANETIAMPIITGDPINIEDALNLPGEEGEAWERARQAEWKNMVNHDIFSPPTHPPPNIKVIKIGTALRTTRQNGKITK